AKNFSGALALKYIHSDINGGRSFQGQSYNPGNSFAADLGFYYQRPLDIGSLPGEFAWGISFLNLGTKISYSDGSEKYFIPATLRLGIRQSLALDEYNSISASVEVSKLMVPTLPLYDDTVLIAGKQIPSSLPQSWIQSFYDAPGGFDEEMKEIMLSVGLEYWYREQFAIRGGYFHENEMKGNRKYFALGIGLRLNVFFIDYSYLVSTSGRNNPLANTMRFTIGFLFNK
ncbi:MAG TPA: type IX secretion system outer membrane channel protein PorV, partial [Bacteroidales bacterium]|nr:type IX secretion system outer membrane channel protein PorV [Bacteroidales bacterium]